jgi:hypothetical protein
LTDEAIVIRRVCQCGKPADHDSVCNRARDDDPDAERVDRQWEEAHSRRREERWEKRKRSIDADRKERRATMTPYEKHLEIRRRQVKISTVPASQVGHSSPSVESAKVGPGYQQEMDADPRWREHWTVINSRFDRLLELQDEAEGLGPVAATTTMLGVEKDRRVIAEGEGLSPLAVVEKLGREIAGSPETVRRIRRKAGRRAGDGTLVEERP